MKKIFCVLLLLLNIFIVLPSTAQSVNSSSRYQRGYVKKNGTYVQGHYKTRSNRTNHDNYSTQSNVNPYTNEKGKRVKDYSRDAYKYGQGKVIQTGPKGGQYYINSKGKKIYVPKRKGNRLCVIVKTCSDSLFSIGQKNCQLFVAKLRNFLDSHNRMVLY